MLDLSRIESGKMAMANRPFALPDLLDSIIVLQSGPAEKKGVVLKESSRHLVHECFLGDDTRIKQCLVNLVSNAVKFTPEQGPSWFLAKSSRRKGRIRAYGSP